MFNSTYISVVQICVNFNSLLPCLQSALLSSRCCVNLLIYLFSLVSLLVEHIDLQAAFYSWPMILNTLLTDYCSSSFISLFFFFHIFKANILNFVKLVRGLIRIELLHSFLEIWQTFLLIYIYIWCQCSSILVTWCQQLTHWKIPWWW